MHRCRPTDIHCGALAVVLQAVVLLMALLALPQKEGRQGFM